VVELDDKWRETREYLEITRGREVRASDWDDKWRETREYLEITRGREV